MSSEASIGGVCEASPTGSGLVLSRAVDTAALPTRGGHAMPRSPMPPTDEALLFAVAIRGSRLCLRCASIKTDIVEERLAGVIVRVLRMLTVLENVEHCESCERRTIVYRLV